MSEASWEHAQRGLQLTGYGGWVLVTAAIVLYFPYERALDADGKMAQLQDEMMGGQAGGMGGSDLFT